MESQIVHIDLARPLPARLYAASDEGIEAIFWLHGRPLGRIGVPRLGSRVFRRGLARSIVRCSADAILRELVRNGMATPGFRSFDIVGMLGLPPVEQPVDPGNLTVVICTEGKRPEQLDDCVAAVLSSGVAPAEALVVWRGDARADARDRPEGSRAPDGASADRQRLQDRWSSMPLPIRHLVEPSADLARARNLALESTRTPLVAFVDEAVRVDPRWAGTVCRTFQDYPNAAVVNGSVLPDGVENDLGRLVSAALERVAWRTEFAFVARCPRPDESFPREWFNAAHLGTAKAVAYRTEDLRAVGGFDAVAVGESADSGQHFDVGLRALESGRCVVREPAASCRGCGTPALAEAMAEVRGMAGGVSAALVAAAARTPRRMPGIAIVALGFLKGAVGDLVRNRGGGRSLAWSRLIGHVTGMACACLALARRRSRRAAAGHVAARGDGASATPVRSGRVRPIELALPTVAVSTAESGSREPSNPLGWARDVPVAEMLATWRGSVLGLVHVVSGFRPISLAQIRTAAIESQWETILLRFFGFHTDDPFEVNGTNRKERVRAVGEAAARVLGDVLSPPEQAVVAAGVPGPPDHDISIVIPSRDRPDQLRECLQAVVAQRTERRVEVIVVDNHPESGLTKQVVAGHPRVRLLEEPRQGAAYARNRGLLACRGSIIACVDDDVVVPEGWLEKMLAPFADPSIGVVTGNVLPLELGSHGERLTEACASLSAGSEPFRVDGEWFHASPVAIQAWEFGTSANMAVRASVFGDPAVGLFEESLGPGTPVGAGEDPYFLYRVVKAGYALRYCPDVWVWHRHRSTRAGLRRQVYNYAKSAVGYYWLTGFRHGDRRSLRSLFGGLQRHYYRRFVAAVRGRIDVPVRIVLAEIAGHLLGGVALFRSEARCRELARDPAHPATPAMLPSRGGVADKEAAAPWVIDQGARGGPPAAASANAASSTVMAGPRN